MTKQPLRPMPVEEVEARAARLGVTPERVLEEYARIAFSSLRDIAEWGPGKNGLQVRPSGELSAEQVAAIAEIVASAGTGTIYRIKLHDKKPVLDAIARYLRMFPSLQAMRDRAAAIEDAEEAREFLIEELDRLTEEAGADPDHPEADRPAGA